MSDLQHEVVEGVSWITLDRPDAANAITADQREQIISLLHDAGTDPDVRVVVLAANGKHFCSGADLSAASGRDGEAAPDMDAPGAVARALRNGTQRLIAAILDCEVPVITELHGAAAGVGAHLVLASDFVIAAEGSRVIEVFVRRALVPDGGGAYLLPRLVGPMVAKRLLLLGDDLSAADALGLGLVTEVVAADDLRPTVAALATRLAAAPTATLALTKWLVNRSLDSSREQCFADEANAQDRNMKTADAQEGLASFGERRAPVFTGR